MIHHQRENLTYEILTFTTGIKKEMEINDMHLGINIESATATSGQRHLDVSRGSGERKMS